MAFLKLFPYYIVWHYTRGITDLIGFFKTMLWFVPSFFSIGTLLKTLFAPFERLSEQYRGGLNVENFLSTLAINTIMRLVGFVIRGFFILIGVGATLGVLVIAILSFIGWILLPALVIFLFILSFRAFFSTP